MKAELRELLEVPEAKAEVAKLSPEENVFPQQTFRLGYAEPEKEYTPRRPLEEFWRSEHVFQVEKIVLSTAPTACLRFVSLTQITFATSQTRVPLSEMPKPTFK